MVRERISLISQEEREERNLERLILQGKLTEEEYQALSQEEQEEVRRILFKMAERNVSLSQGLSTVEFILLSFIRISNKRMRGLALSAEDMQIEEELGQILEMHEITNEAIYKDDWTMDYIGYAKKQSERIIQNREEHIKRKKEIIGEKE